MGREWAHSYHYTAQHSTAQRWGRCILSLLLSGIESRFLNLHFTRVVGLLPRSFFFSSSSSFKTRRGSHGRAGNLLLIKLGRVEQGHGFLCLVSGVFYVCGKIPPRFASRRRIYLLMRWSRVCLWPRPSLQNIFTREKVYGGFMWS